MKKREKIQPHCAVCEQPFWEEDLVHTDTMFDGIQHAECFSWKTEYIKEMGTYGEIVSKDKRKNSLFLILKKPVVIN
ncbi:MAG: hypothetical protein ACQEXB_18340 [Bacillota bacterium]